MRPAAQMSIYALLFVFSFVCVLILTPLVSRLAHRWGAVDYPGFRKIHEVPLPRLGGLAISGSMALGLLLGYIVNPYVRTALPSLRGMMLGAAIILVLGVLDDVRNLSPLWKLPVQTLAASVAVILGTRFQLASNPLAEEIRDFFDLGTLGIPLTIIWIVGMTNAMNLVDGLDGLATGISMFASVALFLISIQQGAGIVTYVYAVVAGSTLAFLRFNRFPARIFLGDTGSTFLGFTFACLSVQGTQKSYTLTALFIPIIVFGHPIFEAIVTLVRRYMAQVKWNEADSDHIHHQLLSSGLTHRQAVWLLYGITIVLGIIGFSFTVLLDEYAAVILVIIGFLGGFLAKELNVFGTRRREGERAIRYADKPADK